MADVTAPWEMMETVSEKRVAVGCFTNLLKETVPVVVVVSWGLYVDVEDGTFQAGFRVHFESLSIQCLQNTDDTFFTSRTRCEIGVFDRDPFNNGTDRACEICYCNELEDAIMISLIGDSEAVYCPQVSWGFDTCFEYEYANFLRRQAVLGRKPVCFVNCQAVYKVSERGFVELVDIFVGGRWCYLYPSGSKR